MPAPAVIPAPKAYINAVAVKGFVVELGVARVSRGVSPSGGLNHGPRNPRTFETNTTESLPSQIPRAMYAGGRP